VSERPLVSFALLAFNEERFIGEAVEGAFLQDYSPLEIVLSDDGSEDRTFEIMRRMAEAYHGPHRLILNRNEKNIGIGAHMNKIFSMAKGKLIVNAGGDDVSFPERTSLLYEEWAKQTRKPTAIHSDYEIIDEGGSPLEGISRQKNPFSGSRKEGIEDMLAYVRCEHPASHVHGATLAWSRRLFQDAGTLNGDVVSEVKALCFRSLACGSLAYVARPLIRYRMHSGNLWGRRSNAASRIGRVRDGLRQSRRVAAWWPALLNNYRKDTLNFISRGVFSPGQGAALCEEIDICLRLRRCELGVYSGSPFASLAWLIRRLLIRPEYRYARRAFRQWIFRTADYFVVLPE
jgi:glycosyltransferase involved in cell wall biosynthesis